ncbi:MAG: hypothetical protein ABR521_01060 [Gaiellaceae bacterium]
MAALVGASAAAAGSTAPGSFPGRNGLILVVGGEEVQAVDTSSRSVLPRTIGGRVTKAPRWSPDGRRAIYLVRVSEDGGADVFAMSANGERHRRLTFRGDVFSAGWSHDGSRLLVEPFTSGRPRVEVMSANGTGRRPLQPPLAGVADVQWSPDGGRLAFLRGGNLHVLTLSTRAERLVARGIDEYAWLPSGQGLMVERRGLEIVSVLGRRIGLAHGVDGGVNEIAVAPDGSQVAYTKAADGDTFLYGARVGSGAEPYVLAVGPQQLEDPDWQPLCTIYGSERADRLRGTSDRDLICGLGGDDVIVARGGDDVVQGGPGNDCILGGAGRDWLFGAAGDDRLLGRDGTADIIDGGPGRDAGRSDRNDEVREIERPLRQTWRCE